MRNLFVHLSLVFGFFLGVFGSGCRGNANAQMDSEALVQSEKSAPLFSLKDTTGQTVSLEDFKGHVVFLDFWATWCPPCRASLPAVEKLYVDYQGKNLQILGLNVDDSDETAVAFTKDNNIPYPVLLAGNSSVAGDYGVQGIPHFVLMDGQGRLVRAWSGYADGFPADWRESINQLLAPH